MEPPVWAFWVRELNALWRPDSCESVDPVSLLSCEMIAERPLWSFDPASVVDVVSVLEEDDEFSDWIVLARDCMKLFMSVWVVLPVEPVLPPVDEVESSRPYWLSVSFNALPIPP